METSLKTGFAQIFSCCPKNLSCPKFGGACSPSRPPPPQPGPYAYAPYIYPSGFDEVEWDFNKSPRVLLIDFKQFMSWVCCLKVMRNILVKAQKYYTFIVVKTHSSRFFSSPFRMVVSHCDTTLFWPFSFVDFL